MPAAFRRALALAMSGVRQLKPHNWSGSSETPLFKSVRDLDHEIAAAEEQQPRCPSRGLLRSSRRSSSQAPGIKGNGALGVGRAHNDVIERADRCGFRRSRRAARGAARSWRFAEFDRDAVRRLARQHKAVASPLAWRRAPLEQAAPALSRSLVANTIDESASPPAPNVSPTLPVCSQSVHGPPARGRVS